MYEKKCLLRISGRLWKRGIIMKRMGYLHFLGGGSTPGSSGIGRERGAWISSLGMGGSGRWRG